MENGTMTPRAQILTAIGVGVAVVLGAVVFTRYEMQSLIGTEAAKDHEAIERLSRKLSALDGRISVLETLPKPDTGTVDTLAAELNTLKETVATHDGKINALEKPVAPAVIALPVATPPSLPAPTPLPVPEKNGKETVALATAVTSGTPYQAEMDIWDKTHAGMNGKFPTLRQHAITGLPTEAALREEFTSILNRQEEKPSDAPRMVQRINTHLAGLVNIRKASDSRAGHAALRGLDASSSLDAMVAHVDVLPTEAQAPFVNWRDAVKDRAEALAELTTLRALDNER